MDLAIATILGSSGVTVGDVAVIDQLIDEARSALSLFLLHLIDGEILTLALLFDGGNLRRIVGHDLLDTTMNLGEPAGKLPHGRSDTTAGNINEVTTTDIDDPVTGRP